MARSPCIISNAPVPEEKTESNPLAKIGLWLSKNPALVCFCFVLLIFLTENKLSSTLLFIFAGLCALLDHQVKRSLEELGDGFFVKKTSRQISAAEKSEIHKDQKDERVRASQKLPYFIFVSATLAVLIAVGLPLHNSIYGYLFMAAALPVVVSMA